MTLVQFAAVLRRRWSSLVVLTLVGIGVGATLTLVMTPMFRAQAQVFVSVDAGPTASDLSQGGSFSESRVASYAELAASPSVLRAAAAAAHVEGTTEQLSRQVRVASSLETVILTITATDPDPQRAAAFADAIAEKTVELVGEIEKTDSAGESLVKLSVYQHAETPSAPASPRVTTNVVVGAFLGLILAIIAAMVREALDSRIRTVDDLRRTTERSVLAEIPVADDVVALRRPEVGSKFSELAESYRQLRTHLTFTNLDGACQVIVVTSAVAGEGKSSTALNLAFMLAQNGHRTLLIDGDLRRPTVADALDLEGSVGLSTVLAHQVELEEALQVVGRDGLHVLASGQVPPNPSELLSSQQMRFIVDSAAAAFDYVIIDAPPALPVTDPAVLGALATGVLMVSATDGHTTVRELEQSLETIDAVGARVVGLVANRVRTGRKPASYYDYSSTEPTDESRRRARRASVG